MVILSDSHNYGRSVVRSNNWLHKPRNLTWEWLLLGDSKLRSLICKHLGQFSINPFELVPTLKFGNLTKNGGNVEFFQPTSHIISNVSEDESFHIGSSLALWSYFGFGDLHWENIIWGRSNGKLVLFPIDLEVAGRDFILPSHTWLIHDATLPEKFTGFFQFQLNLANCISPIHCLHGYHSTLFYLISMASLINQILEEEHRKNRLQSRIIFRKTDEYKIYLNKKNINQKKTGFFKSEIEQLSRGDIPYYFKFLDEDTIYAYDENLNPIAADLNYNPSFKKIKLYPIIKITDNKIEPRQNLNKLLNFGSLQIGKYFLNKAKANKYFAQTKNIKLRLENGHIYLKTPTSKLSTTI